MDLTITLTAEQWNVILFALCDRPFKEVHLLISAIKKQGDRQAQPEAVTTDDNN